MNQVEMKARTKGFALRVLKMSAILPRSPAADVLGRQLIRAATSVAANYRSACRAKSRPDFISKMGTVEEEADESALWIELSGESEIVPEGRLKELRDEANALTAIAVASIRTARQSQANPQPATRRPQLR